MLGAGLEACAASLTKCFSLDLTGCISLPRLLLPEATALRTVRCVSRAVGGMAGSALLLWCARQGAQVRRQSIVLSSRPSVAPPPPPPCSVSGCSLLRQVLLASPLLCHFRAAGCARLMVSVLPPGWLGWQLVQGIPRTPS